MEKGKLHITDRNVWVLVSGDQKMGIDPQHTLWLKVWGRDGMEVTFLIESGLAVLTGLIN